jgi:hypothetical protein
MTTTCPVCARSFRDAHGRGGHLATYNDAAHDEYRSKQGLKHPLGPDGKPTVVGARWRGPSEPTPQTITASPEQPASPALPQETSSTATPSEPAPPNRKAPSLAAPVFSEPVPSLPPGQASPPPVKSTAATLPLEPASPTQAKPSPAAVLIPLGTSILGLAALVMAKKGARNAPTPQTPPPRQPEPFAGIWSQPEPLPDSTGNAWLDNALGYSGIKRRRRWLA